MIENMNLILSSWKQYFNSLLRPFVKYYFCHSKINFNVFFQFMVVTRRGAAGVCVASHVTEELRLALVHAPVPRQHTEDEVVVN